MRHNINVISGEPIYDNLPALLLTCFASDNTYKPYTQFKPAINNKHIYMQMIAFESNPDDESMMISILKINQHTLVMQCTPNSSYCFYFDPSNQRRDLPYKAKKHLGEDLQGKYWAVDVVIPTNIVDSCLDFTTLKGNFHKISLGNHFHQGSLSPVNYAKDLWEDSNLIPLNILDY